MVPSGRPGQPQDGAWLPLMVTGHVNEPGDSARVAQDAAE